MDDLADFFHHARYLLAKAIAWAGLCVDLHRGPETLSKIDRRLCLAELRRYGLMLRRLITLLALSIKLEPLARREGRNWFREETALPKPRGYVFRLVPARLGLPPAIARPDPAPFRTAAVPAAPVIERWNVLLDAVKHMDKKAARLARSLQRQRAAGLSRPYILPMENAHRLPAELGHIAGALYVRLKAAFEDWPDTG